MLTRPFALALCCCLLLVQSAQAADEGPKLSMAHGVIESVDKAAVVILPRGLDGKFDKSVSLKLTGTSTFSLVSTRTTAGKTVLVQKEVLAKDLSAKQRITVIYAANDKDLVLLVAVVEAE